MQHTLFFADDSKTQDEAVIGDHDIEQIGEDDKGKMLMLLVVTLCM